MSKLISSVITRIDDNVNGGGVDDETDGSSIESCSVEALIVHYNQPIHGNTVLDAATEKAGQNGKETPPPNITTEGITTPTGRQFLPPVVRYETNYALQN
jgi:hypothetical protein